jgi:hypothetical protein
VTPFDHDNRVTLSEGRASALFDARTGVRNENGDGDG